MTPHDTAPGYLRAGPAVEFLRQVWGQQCYQEDGLGQGREIADCPPAAMMIASPYDVDSRYSEKRGQSWRGSKGHLTETWEADTPQRITHVETPAATAQDVTVVEPIQQALAQQALLPAVHLVDGADPSGEQLVSSQHDYQLDLTGPLRQDQRWQAHDEQADASSHFPIDWDHESVTCPTGQQSQSWQPAKGPRGKPTIQGLFPTKSWAACEVRARCTRSKTGPRELPLPPQAPHMAMQAARERQQTAPFNACDKRRAGIEGTIAQAAWAFGMRRTRYRGHYTTPLHHIATAAAIHVQRLVDWLGEIPRSKTPQSRLAKLALAT